MPRTRSLTILLAGVTKYGASPRRDPKSYLPSTQRFESDNRRTFHRPCLGNIPKSTNVKPSFLLHGRRLPVDGIEGNGLIHVEDQVAQTTNSILKNKIMAAVRVKDPPFDG